MGNPQHLDWLLEGVEAWNARREREPFDPDLSGMNVREALAASMGTISTLARINLREINLSKSNLNKSNLRSMTFDESDFSGADISEADMSFSMMSDCNCFRTSFRASTLYWVRFHDSDLRFSDFRYADLTNASISQSKINGASFDHALLRSASFFKSDARSFVDQANNNRLVITDFSKAKWLQRHVLDSLIADQATILPARLTRPSKWPEVQLDNSGPQDEYSSESAEYGLGTAIVRASAVDFEFSEDGVAAKLSDAHAIHPPLLGGGCASRRDALIDNTKHIAQTINNQLAEQSRNDLLGYAEHLEKSDPANPHRLNFLAVGIRADLDDEFKSGGFDTRLRKQLESFLEQHGKFLEDCAPAAADAIRTKAEANLEEPVTKEQVTEMLDKLTSAIEATEAATDSLDTMLQQMRRYDSDLNMLKLKITQAKEKAQHEAKVEAEAKELITITSRLYWRAREVVEKHKPKDVRDTASYVTIGGAAIHAATVIIEKLTPVMHWFGKLLSALPPL